MPNSPAVTMQGKQDVHWITGTHLIINNPMDVIKRREYTCYPDAFFSSSSSLPGSETAMSTRLLGMELCSHITLISFS